MTSIEGTLSLDGHDRWYRVVGDLSAAAPLVLLHGGPGCPSYYFEPLERIWDETGRAVVSYDQLGCGRSTHLRDAPSDFWTIDLFKNELRALIDHLGIADRYYLYGQSWGGMLALEHALDHPHGLRGLILANSLSSTALWCSEADRLRKTLPEDAQATLDEHEAAGTTESDEYVGAMMEFYTRYVCRAQPFPECVMQSFMALMEDNTVYSTMWGPSEFTCTGSLSSWDVTRRLGEIANPTLILSGRYDESTPAVNEVLRDGIPGSRWEVLENSAHCSHAEEPERTRELVTAFLAEADAS